MAKDPFRSRFERALVEQGYSKRRLCFERIGDGAVSLVDVQSVPNTRHVNVGFWLPALGGLDPAGTEHCHICLRLESLFPAHFELIRWAGSIGESRQPSALDALIREMSGDMGRDLRNLVSESAIRVALRAGRFANGLVLKEARAFLADDTAGR